MSTVKLHDIQDIDEAWSRRAVPGGWLYYAETPCFVTNEHGESDTEWHIEGATYVPDPNAPHVRDVRVGVTP